VISQIGRLPSTLADRCSGPWPEQARQAALQLSAFQETSFIGSLLNTKEASELWLSGQLRPFGIRPRNLRISGFQAKGYAKEDFLDVFHPYISKAELTGLKEELRTDDQSDAGSVSAAP
jgi:hypothetical protein